MFCKKCGALCSDDAKFCNECGASLTAAEPAEERQSENTAAPEFISTENTDAPVHAVNDPSLPSLSKILVLGIVSLATCEFGIPGIILGSLAKKNAQAVVDGGGSLAGKGTAGRTMGQVGFVFGIIMTVGWTIYTLFSCVAACIH